MAEETDNETSPEVLADILSLATGVMIPAAVVATWTSNERAEAVEWALAEHLHASGNQVKRLPQPDLAKRTVEICASPAMAQLAVENWVKAKEQIEQSRASCAGELLEDTGPLVAAAQAAITGLLVLLSGSQQDEGERPGWQDTAIGAMWRHPAGLRAADLAAMLGGRCPPREALHAWLEEGEREGLLARSGMTAWKLAWTKRGEAHPG
jgi:hypothetical protein